MSKLPALTSRNLIKILKKMEFTNTRRTGSHFFFTHRDGRATVVPVDHGKTLGTGLLKEILKGINMSREEFHKKL